VARKRSAEAHPAGIGSGRRVRRIALIAALAAASFGCPLPYEYNGPGAGNSHSSDPSSPNITAPVTVSYSVQGGTSGTVGDGSSFYTGQTTTVTLSTATVNSVIFYTDNGTPLALTSLDSAKKMNGSSGEITITRTTSLESLDIHAIAIGPNMLPSSSVHATVGVSPYPILSVSCDKASVSEDGGTATFTITSSSAPTGDITVHLLTGGTYVPADLTGPLPASGQSFAATLVHGTTTITLPITGVHDAANVDHTVTLTIQADPNSPPAYTKGAPASASVVLQDDGTYTVTYNGNGNGGGTVPTDGNNYLPGATVTVLGNSGSLVKTGYGFAGWNTQANGSGTTYTQGQTFQMGTANVTLYAIWAPAYMVTYNGNGATGGNVPTDGNSYLPGAQVTVLGNSGSLVKIGYAFMEWGTQANGGGNYYTQGKTFAMGSTDVTLYANWAPSIATVAGNGTAGYSGDNGPATSAQLGFPWGIALDASGNFYFADNSTNHIRKVSTNGTITTVAGTGTAGYSGDNGPATSAEVNGPTGVAVDASGNLYIADSYNGKVRKVAASGTITTITGPWTEPMGVATDSAGNLYVSDYFAQVWKYSTGGTITTVAGTGTQGYSGDGGPATSAMLHGPWGVAVDSSGNVYIADQYNSRIRKVSTSGTITTVAGNGTAGYSGDGGPATSAMLYNPQGIAVDAAGNLYICDVSNLRIRNVSMGGQITTVAGNGNGGYSGDGGAATSTSLSGPRGAAFDPFGSLYIADSGNNRIRKVTAP